MDLTRADAGWLMLSGCGGRGADIVLAAAGVVVLGRHMKTVAVHFEVDTAVLGCESLSLVSKK